MTETSPTEDLERAILAALLIDSSRLADLDGPLAPEDFTEGPRRATYEAMLALYREGKPVDLVTTSAELRRRQPGIPAAAALAKLTSHPGAPSHLCDYAERLRAIRTITHLQGTLAEGIEDLRCCPHEPDAVSDLVTDLTLRVESHAIRVERSQEFDLSFELNRAFADMQKADEPPGIESGFYELDRFIHGLRPGKLLVVAGRPGMGKSAFALTMARRIARDGARTVIFSMEMLRQELVQRMIAAEADIDLNRIIGRRLSESEIQSAAVAISSIRDLPLVICDEASVSMAYVRSAIRRAAKSQPVDCVVVDYIQILESKGKAESRHLEIGSYSRELKRIAQEFEIPVVAVAMLNRQVESREDKRPRLSDLRESGSIEQDADTVLFLYRPGYYEQKTKHGDSEPCEVIVAKNRGGRMGSFELTWTPSRTRFTNPSPQFLLDGASKSEEAILIP